MNTSRTVTKSINAEKMPIVGGKNSFRAALKLQGSPQEAKMWSLIFQSNFL